MERLFLYCPSGEMTGGRNATSYNVESGDLFDRRIVLSGVLDLIQSGAKVSKRSFEGKSALHLAALR